MSRRLCFALVGALASSFAIVAAATPAAATDQSTLLPLGDYSHMVVDSAHGLVFVTGGVSFGNRPGVAGIAVANADGSASSMIAGTSAATGITLGPDGLLYAAEADGHIAVIDPATKTLTQTYNTGDVCPDSVAFAGTELWFSYGCSPDIAAGLAELDTGTGTITSGVLEGVRSGRAVLAAIPGSPGELVATNMQTPDADLGAGDLDILTISGTTATVSKTVSGVSIDDLAVSPDGSSVVVAGGAAARTYSTTDLSDTGVTYNTPLGGSGSVAYSADGTYVAVASTPDPFDATVTTFGPSSTTEVRSYDTSTPGSANQGQNNLPQLAGLAWSGHVLLAIYVDYLGAYPKLTVYNSAITAPTAMTLTGPSSATRTKTLSLHGTLTSNGVALSGVTLAVSKSDLDGTHTLHSVTTSGSGAFTISDTPGVGGTNTYHVSYPGDATHAPASKSIKVSVSRNTTTLTIKTNAATYGYNATATVTAHLGTTFSNHQLALYITRWGGSKRLLKQANVDRHGNLSVTANVTNRTVFTASFSGDERWTPSTVKVIVKVHARVGTKIGQKIGTDGKYGVYSAVRGGSLSVTVSPNKSGESVGFVLQVYVNGAWHTATTDTEGLDGSSFTAVFFWGDPGHHYRVRAQYGGDAANLSQNGVWYYAEFR